MRPILTNGLPFSVTWVKNSISQKEQLAAEFVICCLNINLPDGILKCKSIFDPIKRKDFRDARKIKGPDGRGGHLIIIGKGKTEGVVPISVVAFTAVCDGVVVIGIEGPAG